MTTRSTILEATHDRVRLITFNRPQARNAFDSTMYDEAADALRVAQADDAIRVVVVTGAGDKAFSAGQDIAEMARLTTEASTETSHGFPRFMDRLTAFDKPLIAAVNGVGVGIGFTMLLHCDLVFMATTARLRAPFVPLGVVPEAASSYLLPATIGWQRATEILLTGRWVGADEASTLGIAWQVCPPETVVADALAKATTIAEGVLGSLRGTKRVMNAARSDLIRAAREREDLAFQERIGTPENLEAVMKFLSGRGL